MFALPANSVVRAQSLQGLSVEAASALRQLALSSIQTLCVIWELRETVEHA